MAQRYRLKGLRTLGWMTALLIMLPLLLSACGSDAATALPATASTSSGAATSVSTTTASTAATTKPAATTAMTAAIATTGGTTAPVAMTGTTAPVAAAGMATPAAMPALPANLTLPASVKRGDGGTLRLLWWQAPTILNLHLAQGTKDFDASRLVVEPLATFTDGQLLPNIPVLAKEIPSTQNGQLAADSTSVTWKLKEGIVWSDGVPFTADDVVFTYQFIIKPESGVTTSNNYNFIKDVTAVDPTTVKITFKAASPAWMLPFTGSNGAVLPKHSLEACKDAKACPYNLKPIGTGPYIVTDFRPGDTVLYDANPKFREANAPFFAKVEMKGGGDAVTAMKAVQTGQADYVWNPQVTPDIFKQFTDAGGVLENAAGTSTEKIYVNFADPTVEVDGEKSSVKAKSPFWTDKNVRQALSLAIDRDTMAKNLYAVAGTATNTVIPNIYSGLDWKYDPKQASSLLDAAGWKPGNDGVRVKDGRRFSITFRTSVNSVRDKESLLIQQNLKAIGIEMQLKPVDSAVFFGQPDNPDNLSRFETDLQMYTNGPSPADVQSYMNQLTSDQIAQKANGWKNTQVMRWTNADYDNTIKELTATLDPAKRVELYKKADGILIGDYAIVPLVARRYLSGHVKGLEGVNLSYPDSDVWNIAHWTLKK